MVAQVDVPETCLQAVLINPPEEYQRSDIGPEQIATPRVTHEGDVVVRIAYLAADPTMRSSMTQEAVGHPLSGFGIGRVVESKDKAWQTGDYAIGRFPWAEYALFNSKPEKGSVTFVPTKLVPEEGIPLSAYLSVLGMPGQTAWAGMKGLCEIKAGETVFVTGASGAVGTVAGQIAKKWGCQVIGSTGSAEKARELVETFGFDGAFDYRSSPDPAADIRRLCPDGIDVLFENVGGKLTNTLFEAVNLDGRLILCGVIANYNPRRLEPGPPLLGMLERRIRILPFHFNQYPDLIKEWISTGAKWIKKGHLKHEDTIIAGLDQASEAIGLMLTPGSKAKGKIIVQVAAETA